MYNENSVKERFKEDFRTILFEVFDKTVDTATDYEKYFAAARVCRKEIAPYWNRTEELVQNAGLKRVYYFSQEFLPGRLLGNNLINLGMKEELGEAMKELGIDLNLLEDQEEDPALGNGGLGRLASCFLESLTTQGYPAYGCSLRYQKGLFKQKIVNGKQMELPDIWEKSNKPYPMGREREDCTQYVTFGRFPEADYQVVKAVPFDVPIVGYPEYGRDNMMVNSLRLWDAPDHPEIVEHLYPSDKTTEGKKLRIKQEYFFVSATLQQMIKEFKTKYTDFRKLPDMVCLHINDTHPAVVIPELMRLLRKEKDVDGKSLSWDTAWEITTKCCAYTNHTVMKEALEKWPIQIYKDLLPGVYEIIDDIHHKFEEQVRVNYPGQEEKVRSMAILYEGEVRMANLAVAASFSVNGVAKLHTEILKTEVFKDFYEMMPKKFNNKTNGVSHRRFLVNANQGMSKWITECLGDSRWHADLNKLNGLEKIANDIGKQNGFIEAKLENKRMLKKYIKETRGIDVNEHAIFDVHVKRLHEYKRQLMNVERNHCLCYQLKKDILAMESFEPMVFILAAKAHPDYETAKDIIKEIYELENAVNNDKELQGKITVVFLENFNVTLAEKIYPASDISEQISTAGTEASGTGNMKFMMNGAITLGTLDGANVEIKDAVGEENMFLFGMKKDEVAELKRRRDYIPSHIYLENPDIQYGVDCLKNKSLKNKLIYPQGPTEDADPYFVLKDLKPYIEATWKLNQLYKDKEAWNKMAILNVANSGYFSIDRTVKEYVNEIWHLESINSYE